MAHIDALVDKITDVALRDALRDSRVRQIIEHPNSMNGAPAMPAIDVAVVGAGLAGIYAARTLADAGREIAVFEARERVGGRTWSEPFPGTSTRVDLGAEWVCPQHRVLLAEYDRHGVALQQSVGGEPRWRLAGEIRTGEMPVDGEDLAGVDRVFEGLEDAAAALLAVGDSYWRPDSALDGSFASWLDTFDLTPTARSVAQSLGYTLMGTPAELHAVSALVQEVASFGGDARAAFLGQARRVEGGADTLAIRAARGLPILTGKTLTSVTVDISGVTLGFTDLTEVTARAVVLAVPLNVLSDIQFTPELPAGKASLIAEKHAGDTQKIWVRATGVAAGETVFGGASPIEAYTIGLNDGGALVGTFGLADTPPSMTPALAEDSLRDFYPDISITQLFGHNWVTDPYAQGTWLAGRPGQWERLQTFRDAAGPLFFAGGDIASSWSGWMEGAIVSGIEAAKAAHNHL